MPNCQHITNLFLNCTFPINTSSPSFSQQQLFKPLFLLIPMNTTFLSLFSFLFFFLSSSALRPISPNGATPPSHIIDQACRATQHPDACVSMVSTTGQLGPGSTPSDIIQAAFSASITNLNSGRKMVKDILDSSSGNQNRSRAAKTCLEGLDMAEFRTSSAMNALARQASLRNARAWLSAALTYQYGCWSGLKYVNDSSSVNSTMSFFDTTVIVSTSNALSMLGALDIFGPDLASWNAPRTERDGFWEPVLGSGATAPEFDFTGLSVDATVCKDASDDCYKTVQKAVDAAPDNLKGEMRFVIKIMEGVYEEIVRVPFNKTNLVFIGNGMGKTVITGSLNAGMQGISTHETATVGILGDGFRASGITFQNTAPPPTHQAVAFRSTSDLSFIENCEFLGNQDTLYVHSLRQFYKSCRIEGNVDFIFGNGGAILQDCTILVRPRQVDPEKGAKNTIAAHGRTDRAETTGLVFLGCHINGTDEYMKLYNSKPSVHLNYLARPWKMYSRTIYINCTMEALINPEGWMPWDGDFALSTLYYGEFGNSGVGADMSKRVPWSTMIPKEHVSTYYFPNFLQGDEWKSTASL